MPTIQKVLGLQLYTTTCTLAMKYLFNWNCSCISKERRPMLFKSIFSPSSVKGIKHWFQMVKAQELIRYHDKLDNEIYDNNVDNFLHNVDPYMKILKEHYQSKKSLYDLNNIECKIAVIAGDEDKLIDPYIVQKKIKNCLVTYVIKNYEHLDLIWADDANILVFPKILKLLEKEKIF
jgi:pimeloyl-ACP methyl ester carboxylesterase